MASDKQRGILGKCDLDIAKFDYDDFRMHTIEIRECAYEGATIEIGLKASLAMRSSTRNQNALNESMRSMTSESSAAVTGDPQAAKARFNELFDEYSDLKKKNKQESSERVKTINNLKSRSNDLQTEYENAK